MKPRMVDLFCGPGGAAAGFIAAGWDVTGVDQWPQPWYPGEFILADAMTFSLAGFDGVHASPPCQRWAAGAANPRARGFTYPDLLTPTLARLANESLPWVVENVPGAPGPWQVMYCGTMFELPLMRHRYFAANWDLPLAPRACNDKANRYNVYDSRTHGKRKGTDRTFCDAMGVTWAPTHSSLGGQRHKVALEAIPPAYTEFIGRAMVREVMQRA